MDEERGKGMTLIVKTVSRLTAPLVLVYGIYIVLHGHVSPGGGFAGGTIIALAYVNIVLAFGKEAAHRKFSKSRQTLCESMGAILFLTVGLLGFTGGVFFLNVLPKGQPFGLFSAGLIPVSNIAIGVKVAAGLAAMFGALALLNLDGDAE